jgi:hypothetical protein
VQINGAAHLGAMQGGSGGSGEASPRRELHLEIRRRRAASSASAFLVKTFWASPSLPMSLFGGFELQPPQTGGSHAAERLGVRSGSGRHGVLAVSLLAGPWLVRAYLVSDWGGLAFRWKW